MHVPDDERQHLLRELVNRAEQVADRLVTRVRSDIPAFARLSVDEVAGFASASLLGWLTCMLEDRDFTSEEHQAFHECGQQRASQGVSSSELLMGNRLSIQVIMEELRNVGRARDINDRTLLEVTHELLDRIDSSLLDMNNGHRMVELRHARFAHEARENFIREALTARLSSSELSAMSQRFELDPFAKLVPFHARAPSPDDLPTLVTRVASKVPDAFTATVDDSVIGFTRQRPKLSISYSLGLGPAATLAELPASFSQATRASATASAFGLKGAYELPELGLLPSVLADSEVGDIMVRRYVKPVEGSRSQDLMIETVERYLQCGNNVDKAAVQLQVHPNTVRYRLSRYEALAEVDLAHTQTKTEVWWAIKRAKLKVT